MTWNGETWKTYLDYHRPEEIINLPIVCIKENPRYSYLISGRGYRLIDTENNTEEEMLYFYVVSLLDYSHDVYTEPKKYNCEYFVPSEHYIAGDTGGPPRTLKLEMMNCMECNQEYPKINLTRFHLDTDLFQTFLCPFCYSFKRIDNCDYCYQTRENIVNIRGVGRLCPTCIQNRLQLKFCKSCNKKGFFDVQNQSKYVDKYTGLCETCKEISFERLQEIYNYRTIRVLNPFKPDTFMKEYKRNESWWYINSRPSNKERTYGIEFEVQSKSLRMNAVINILKDLSKVKIDKTHTLRDLLSLKYDGSLGSQGLEFITVVLSGEKSYEYVRQIVEILNKYTYTDKQCGLHIHLGAKDYAPTELAKLYYFYNRFQKLFKFYVKPTRLRSRFCKRLKTQPKHKLLAGDILSGDRYSAINFHSLRQFKTVELRILEGTLNADKIIEWVMLHTKILDSVIKDDSLLVSEWRIPQKTRHIIGNKLYLSLKNKMRQYKEDNLTPRQVEINLSNAMNFMYKEEQTCVKCK